jgi:shikimate kinase / 3-dehydroquinate synthase
MEQMQTVRAADALRILIIGPTGAGKTTTGQALARLLGWRFMDLDHAIATATGRSVAAIFAGEGVEGWRTRETAALSQALELERVVIAAGAGIVERETNRALLRQPDLWVVALDVAPESSLQRIQAQAAAQGAVVGDLRPMLAGPDPLAPLREMRARRAPLYDALAVHTLNADEDSAPQVAACALAGLIVAGRLPAESAETRVTHVAAGAGYDAVTGWGALAALPQRLTALKLPPRLTIISDTHVGALYGAPLSQALLAAGFEPALITVPTGEASKSRASLDAIHDHLAERRAERGEAILALGGGVIGDLAGFAAATWLRGVPLVHLPTSLLAQVDASIGGKVAVDHPRGKNLIGAFYQPRLVLADTATLLTLPDRVRIEGWAEVIKHGAALDATYFTTIERDVEALLTMRPASLTAAITGSVAIKGAIVADDEREAEGGRRALLNFGHTLGHAIETITSYSTWLHGEAVSAGMVFAARLGVRLGVTPAPVAKRVEALLARFGLPTRLDGLSASALLHAIQWDKKARGGRVRWIMLTELGASAVADGAPEVALRTTLAELGALDDAGEALTLTPEPEE